MGAIWEVGNWGEYEGVYYVYLHLQDGQVDETWRIIFNTKTGKGKVERDEHGPGNTGRG